MGLRLQNLRSIQLLIAMVVICVALAASLEAWADEIQPSRVAAMGGAGIALGGLEVVWCNPAGIFWHPEQGLEFGLLTQGDSVEEGYAVFFQPDNGLGAGALSWQRRVTGEDGSTVDQWMYTLAAEWDLVYVGGAVSWVNHRQALTGEQHGGIVLDLGLLVRLDPEVALGASVKNLYTSVPKYLPETESAISVGLGWQAGTNTVVAVDLANITQPSVEVRLGAEHRLTHEFVVRMGWAKQLNTVQEERWAVGCGFQRGFWALDYTLQAQDEITHQLGLRIEL